MYLRNSPYFVLMDTYRRTQAYDKLAELLTRLRALSGDQSLTPLIEQYKQMAKSDTSEVSGGN